MDEIITQNEAAKLFGGNPHEVRGLIRFGELKPVRIGNPVLIRKTELLDLMQRRGVQVVEDDVAVL